MNHNSARIPLNSDYPTIVVRCNKKNFVSNILLAYLFHFFRYR